MNYAPLTVFAFQRPDHLRRTLDSVANNPEASQTPLIVYLDHPQGFQRTEKSLETEEVARSFAPRFASFELIVRPYNFGLSWNIINGVTEVVEKHGRIIVLEDDILVSPDFLKYMNTALVKYADESRVASIHAYVYPGFDWGNRAFWRRGADCWGWGTWKRAWSRFEPDGYKLLNLIFAENSVHAFNVYGHYDYTQLLLDHVEGRVNSWAVRWHASAFVLGMLTLQPPHPLAINIGFDGSGTHCSTDEAYLRQEAGRFDFSLPERIKENRRATEKLFRGFVKSQHSMFRAFIQPLGQKFKRYFGRLYNLLKGNIQRGNGQNHRICDGDFPNWESALKKAGGYDSDQIAQKCFRAAREVFEGRAVAERDSVLLSHQEVRLPVLAGLLMAISRDRNEIVDFGGAFGSAFRMFQPFLRHVLSRWTVIEQETYVRLARSVDWEEKLGFDDNLEQALSAPRLAAVLVSGSLQYVPRPDLIIKAFKDHKVPYIVLDRTSVWPGPNRITVQTVPPSIYTASYPAWVFNEKWLLNLFEPEYELVADFPSLCTYFNLKGAEDKGYIFRRKDHGTFADTSDLP